MFKHFNTTLVSLGFLFITNVLSLTALAENITGLKAAELACHRVERLILQKKIDKSYLSKFQKITVIPLSPHDPSGGAFLATVYQTAPLSSNEVPFNLSIILDFQGMVLNYKVNDGGSPGTDIVWSGKDPLSLTEAGLHFILDNKESEELSPFINNFSSLVIEQKTINDAVVAEIVVSNSLNNSKLILSLDLNGKFLNKEVTP